MVTLVLVSCFSVVTLAVVKLYVFSMYKKQLGSLRHKTASGKAKEKPMNEALVVELRLLVSLVDVNLIVHFKY